MTAKKELKTFGETIGARAFPDATEAELKDIIDKQIVVKNAAYKQMKFGECAIVLFNFPDDNVDFSTLVGGEVVVKKLKEAQEKGLLPLLGTIVHNEVYYDIV